MSISILVVAIVPFVLWWAIQLATTSRVVDGIFRPSPVLRIVYPAGTIAIAWVFFMYIDMFWQGDRFGSGDWLGLFLSCFFLFTSLYSWPITIRVTESGLKVSKLFFIRHVAWADIDDTYFADDQSLVVTSRNSKPIIANSMHIGRYELKQIVEKHIKQNAEHCVSSESGDGKFSVG